MDRLEVQIRFVDFERVRLLVWEMVMLRDQLRLLGYSDADRINGILDRFMADIAADLDDQA